MILEFSVKETLSIKDQQTKSEEKRHNAFEQLMNFPKRLPADFDCMRRVHTPPLGANEKGMCPETNTLQQQHTPSTCGGVVDYKKELMEAIDERFGIVD